MKERPILFSGPMVRALLAGNKTQTRRVVKPQPPANTVRVYHQETPDFSAQTGLWYPEYLNNGRPWTDGASIKCPYGVPGDLLWVREKGALVPCHRYDKYSDGVLVYPDIGDRVHRVSPGNSAHCYIYAADGEYQLETGQRATWTPSIHMPRWASRLTLRITDVRVERVQEISEEDAKAEGVEPTRPLYGDCGGWKHEGHKDSFINLWDSINGDKPGRSWADNPWVWTLKFERVMTCHEAKEGT